MMQLFYWMGINSKDLLIGLDHVMKICAKIDDLMTDKTKPTGLTKSGTRWESSVQI